MTLPATPSEPQPPTHAVTPKPASPHAPPSRWAVVSSAGQFVVSLVATLAVLAYLLLKPASKPAGPEEQPPETPEAVRSVGPWLVRIDSDTPLGKKLQIVEVRPTRITAPVLTVTGTVVASLRPSSEKKYALGFMAIAGVMPAVSRGSDYWQFNAPEVLTAFTDWQKATADIAFAKAQLVKIREAAVARSVAQSDLVSTMTNLVAAGTETKKQLALERATFRQYEIQQDKEIYEAETAVRVAQRNEAALARQLQQGGLDPELLTSVTSDVDIVMADVPEGFLSRVKVGQGCTARFFGIPDDTFTGSVRTIAPTLSKERRSLRVLFTIEDLIDQLRPGMFAEIGLGTDPRNALLAPADGVIHVGRADYMLVADKVPGVWRVTPVEVGEVRDTRVEITEGPNGLKANDRVIGQGAILLKPSVMQAVQANGNGGGK